MVRCQVCGREFKQITLSHLKSHNHTFESYRLEFPDSELVSSEVKAKLSASNSGKVRSDEHRKKLSESIRKGFMEGRTQHNQGVKGVIRASEETRRKQSEAHLGKTHSEETKAKIGAKHKGKVRTELEINKWRESYQKSIEENGGGFNKGKPRSDELKAKMSEIAKNRPREVQLEKAKQMQDARRGSKATPEQRENYREARLAYMQANPENIGIRWKDTKPELEFAAEMDKRGIKYQKQWHSSKPHYLYDFKIGDCLVEIDGPYHHNEKIHKEPDGLEKQILRDAEKNLAAGKLGCRIFRIRVEDKVLPDNWIEILHQQGWDLF